MRSRSLAAWAAAWCAALGLAVMQGCGGGVGSGGTGMSEGVAQGTVNGFGSVIVDGDRFDDSRVPTLAEIEPGVLTQTEARLGERVELEYDTAGVARRLMVQSALVGAVETVSAPAGFSCSGNRFWSMPTHGVGPSPSTPAATPASARCRPARRSRCMASSVRGASGFSIQATRVKKRSALSAYLKVTGLASEWARRTSAWVHSSSARRPPLSCPRGGRSWTGRSSRCSPLRRRCSRARAPRRRGCARRRSASAAWVTRGPRLTSAA